MFLLSSILLIAKSLIPKEYQQLVSDAPTDLMFNNLRAQPIIVPTTISNEVSVLSTFAYYSPANRVANLEESNKSDSFSSIFAQIPFFSKSLTKSKASTLPPIVLLHGFDSSCLEFRKLAPLLSENLKCDVYVPDILGWGFSDHTNVTSFTPDAKIAHLVSFLQQVVKKPSIVVGASLVSLRNLLTF